MNFADAPPNNNRFLGSVMPGSTIRQNVTKVVYFLGMPQFITLQVNNTIISIN